MNCSTRVECWLKTYIIKHRVSQANTASIEHENDVPDGRHSFQQVPLTLQLAHTEISELYHVLPPANL
jgi:hypothetical protein